eukprot:TRINITY_DN3721_c0_g2_i1.p1 TRINITY_DN3721_c0_g2~~TRINITY_DN3721_c0_g2_i1.p1  ORF type:complete len:115 (+),score=7.50 TRINITY_DN3721_c0_g2_i1:85-429(+)
MTVHDHWRVLVPIDFEFVLDRLALAIRSVGRTLTPLINTTDQSVDWTVDDTWIPTPTHAKQSAASVQQNNTYHPCIVNNNHNNHNNKSSKNGNPNSTVDFCKEYVLRGITGMRL